MRTRSTRSFLSTGRAPERSAVIGPRCFYGFWVFLVVGRWGWEFGQQGAGNSGKEIETEAAAHAFRAVCRQETTSRTDLGQGWIPYEILNDRNLSEIEVNGGCSASRPTRAKASRQQKQPPTTREEYWLSWIPPPEQITETPQWPKRALSPARSAASVRPSQVWDLVYGSGARVVRTAHCPLQRKDKCRHQQSIKTERKVLLVPLKHSFGI